MQLLKDQKKTKGKARIEAMLREKRPLKVYTIKKEDCPEFVPEDKRGYKKKSAADSKAEGKKTAEKKPAAKKKTTAKKAKE